MMQRYRNQQIRQAGAFFDNVITHQVTQDTAFGKLPVKLQGPHQLVGRKAILQRADSVLVRRRILDTLPAGSAMSCRQWQTTLVALRFGPWQVAFTGFANTYWTRRLTAEYATWWQQVVDGICPCSVSRL